MRIISKIKDYYDTAQAGGVDPKLVYVRQEKYIPGENLPGHCLSARHSRKKGEDETRQAIERLESTRRSMPRGEYGLTRTVIAFCGKMYPFYYVGGDKAFYDLEKLIKHLSSLIRNNIDAKQTLNRILSTPKYTRYYNDLCRTTWKRFQEEFNPELGDGPHRFFKSPVLLIDNQGLVVNPILRKYQFATQVDPYTAFQELSMFVGNNLVDQMDPKVHIPDKLKAESKGFNEWSFRTPKNTKKRKNR